MKSVVVDVEIIKTIDQCTNGWDSTDEMGVGVAVVYEREADRFRIYGPEEVEELKHSLLLADRISGYNIWSFDFPVIWGISKSEWTNPSNLHAEATKALKAILGKKTNDILRRIWLSLHLNPDTFYYKTHGGYKLDDVAAMTLGLDSRKIAHGAQAPIWYQEGLIQRVANYCVDDVTIERNLEDFVDSHGYIIDPNDYTRLPLTVKDPLWETDEKSAE